MIITLRSVATTLQVALGICLCHSVTMAQKLKVVTSTDPKSDGFGGMYLLAFVFGIMASGIVFWWLYSRAVGGMDDHRSAAFQPSSSGQRTERRSRPRTTQAVRQTKKAQAESVNLKAKFDDLIKRHQEFYRRLPVFDISEIREPRDFEQLPHSGEPELDLAIERSNAELESDPDVRENALEFLQHFKTSNSVEAVADVAAYDLCAGLRSKAIAVLAHYDHESVFESMLLGCADPSREVRAAAARSLMKLSCDRIDAWVRISESGDITHILQAARAIIAGDLVTPWISRLIHHQQDAAAEALAVMGVLIRAGETTEIIANIQNNEPQIAKALLHAVRMYGDQAVMDELATLVDTFELSEEIASDIFETLRSSESSTDHVQHPVKFATIPYPSNAIS